MKVRTARRLLGARYGWDDVRLVRAGSMTFGWTVGWGGRPIRAASWATARHGDLSINHHAEAERVWEMLKKETHLKKGDLSRPQLADERFQEQYPLLWSHLTQRQWEDGSPRQCSTLLVFCQEGVLKAMLRDVEAGQVLWVAAPSYWGLLEAVEGSLESPDADWRVDRRSNSNDTAKRVKRS